MRSLARWCFRRKFVVLAVWVVALLVLGGLSASAGSGYTDSFSLPGTESTTALNLLTDNFNTESTDTNQVVFAADDVNDPAIKARIEKTLDAVAKGPHVERVDSPFAEGAAARQISKYGTVAFANVHMDGEQPIADVPKSAYDKLIDTAQAARGDGLQVELGGSGIQQASQQQGGGPSEFIGFLAAAVVLAIGFGSLWATLLPLITAVLALGCGLSLTGLLAHAIDIATFAPTLATLIGLGVGIDYALFVVTRHRNAITAGRDPEAACMRALNTSGRAVLFAGGTVIVALLGLFVLGISFLNGVAVASAIIVLITMTAAVTLIPALLGIIGMRVLSKKERRRLAAEGPRDRSSTASGPAGPGPCRSTASRLRSRRSSSCWRSPSRRCRCGWAPPTPARTRPPRPPARPMTCSPKASARASTAPSRSSPGRRRARRTFRRSSS
jgi:RND superfamily putative drug exporter